MIEPNETLYVNNLNEKIKLDELKINLFHLFSEFGDIIEINCRKSQKMKGQAFIVYKDLNSSTNAKFSLNNTIFLGKKMKIEYSKNTSDIINKLKNNVNLKEKLKIENIRKLRRKEEYSLKLNNNNNKNKINKTKKNNNEDNSKNNVEYKNKILFVENLPSNINISTLNYIFGKFSGLVNINYLSEKKIAFIEYNNEFNAGIALLGLNNYKITKDTYLNISFAKN
jgi:RNA recognition motif-containing protein